MHQPSVTVGARQFIALISTHARVGSTVSRRNRNVPASMDSPSNCETRGQGNVQRKAQTRCRRRRSRVVGAWHNWADRGRVWAAPLTDNGFEIFQDLHKMRSEHDLKSLELRYQGSENKWYFLLHATAAGPAHDLVKNTTMDRYVAWLKLSREYDLVRRPHGGVPTRYETGTSRNQGASKVVSSYMGDERG